MAEAQGGPPRHRLATGPAPARRWRGPGFLLVVVAVVAVVAVLASSLACSAQRPPVHDVLVHSQARTPVVFVPGITGSQLRDRESGRILWGDFRSLFLPRDGGYRIALPLHLSADEDPGVEAPSVITRFRILGLFTVDVYESLVQLFTDNGYHLGDLQAPRPGDSFFLFPYDWRFENVHTARELARHLDRLRRVRGEDVLHVHLICQSNAARIARYLVKYGDASLEAAQEGTAAPLERIRIDKLILVGTANGGALATLHELLRGRTYVALLGRKIRPEVLFTYRSVYEELPAYRDDLFMDSGGRPVAADLFDARTWQRYGWSVFAEKVERRLARVRRQDLFGTPEERLDFLAHRLDAARRVHTVLGRDAPAPLETKYYLVQNSYEPTPAKALVTPAGRGWRTLFSRQKALRRDPYLFSLASSPGDGHATVESQMRLSPHEHAALSHPPVNVSDAHRTIILNPATHRWLLEFLAQ